MSVTELEAEIRERLADAERVASECEALSMNSYGAGHARGVVDALKDVLALITGDEM